MHPEALARKLRALQASPFRAATLDAQHELAREALFDEFRGGADLCTMSEPASAIWIVSDPGRNPGLIAEYIPPFRDLDVLCTALLQAGDIVGQDAVLSSATPRYAASATAQVRTEVLILPIGAVEAALRAENALLIAWHEHDRARLAECHRRMRLGAKPAVNRLAMLLMLLAERSTVRDPITGGVVVPRPFGTIAGAFLGSVRQTFSADLNVLADHRIVRLSGRQPGKKPDTARIGQGRHHTADDYVVILDMRAVERLALGEPLQSGVVGAPPSQAKQRR
jgi:CRP-like cAMP-binding protein